MDQASPHGAVPLHTANHHERSPRLCGALLPRRSNLLTRRNHIPTWLFHAEVHLHRKQLCVYRCSLSQSYNSIACNVRSSDSKYKKGIEHCFILRFIVAYTYITFHTIAYHCSQLHIDIIIRVFLYCFYYMLACMFVRSWMLTCDRCLWTCVHLPMFTNLHVCLSGCRSVGRSVCLSVCLSVSRRQPPK